MTEKKEIKKAIPTRETVQTRSAAASSTDVKVSVTPAKPKKH